MKSKQEILDFIKQIKESMEEESLHHINYIGRKGQLNALYWVLAQDIETKSGGVL